MPPAGIASREMRAEALPSRDAYDVIVLGSGAGGMTAAAMAAAEGLSVLLIEKSDLIGGTTAFSGGMVWIPANAKMGEADLVDSLDAARTYLRQTVGDTADDRLEAFLANGDRAIQQLERKTSVRLRPVKRYPDYYPDLPGATLGGRVLEPVPFDGRLLGERFKLLRRPLPEFTLFGGMMVDRADIPHFRKVGRSVSSTWRVAKLAARYARERLSAGRGTSLYLGNALAARLLHSLVQTRVDIRLNTAVKTFARTGGAVTGVILDPGGTPSEIQARHGVVLATGGFSHHAAMRERYLPPQLRFSAVCNENTGDGIALGEAAGAGFAEAAKNNGFWVPVSRFRRRDGSESVFPHTVTDRAKPGLIAVNREGRRFTNEACSYHEFVLSMLRSGNEAAAVPAYLICDKSFLWKYGLGAIKPFSLSVRDNIASGYLTAAGTIADLGSKLGIESNGLNATVAHFNEAAKNGEDLEFGRGSDAYQRHLGDADVMPNACVAPIVTPPFYAIAVYPGDLGTAAGLRTNRDAQVLDRDGSVLKGLYACGNDMSSVMEGAYPGPGITLGPALTFGVIAAERLAAS
jgi:succinate dehydrogenase/fumarate reductase flavoprotein subunit